MMIEITKNTYKGILLELSDDYGWKCNLGGQEYLFPNYVAAQGAIDEIYRDVKTIVAKHDGKKLRWGK